MAAFDLWAKYYDLIHDGLPGDVDFYKDQARKAGGELLELGVGTGRIALPAVQAGMKVTGLDDSANMLRVCRSRRRALGAVSGKLTLVHADMTDFDLGRRFACVTMPYRTFMHLLSPEPQAKCLRCVRRHLEVGGVLVLDVWVPRAMAIAVTFGGPIAEKLKLVGRYPLRKRGVTLEHHHASSCDEHRQWLTELNVLREVDSKGRVLSEATLPLVRAWTTPRELEYLARLNGFRLDAAYGDFCGTPFTSQSTDYVCRFRAC